MSDAHGLLAFHEPDIGGSPVGNIGHYAYTDNLGVMSLSAATTTQVWDEVTKNFGHVGPKTHEHVLSSGPVTG